MAGLSRQVLRGLFSFWMYIGLTLLIITNSSYVIYWTFAFPFFCFALNKWSLQPVDEFVAEEVLGKRLFFSKKVENDIFQKTTIAHRTAAMDAPENTLAGIRKAKHDGASGVEFDVRFTKDQTPILFHDDKVDRTTNGHGFVSDMTLSEIKALDASKKHINHGKYKGETVPTLDEAIKLCLKLDLKIFLEMKELHPLSVSTVLEFYLKYPELYKKCAVVSFYPTFLYRLRSKDPDIVTVLVWRPCYFAKLSAPSMEEVAKPRFPNNPMKQMLAALGDVVYSWSFHNILWHVCGVSGVFIHRTVISQDYLKHWSRLRMQVVAWVVDNPIEKEYMSSVLRLPVLTDTCS